MAEMTVSDQVWKHLINKHGIGGVVPFDPPAAGKIMQEYQAEMKRLGFCPYCEGKLDDENHVDRRCLIQEQDEQEVWVRDFESETLDQQVERRR